MIGSWLRDMHALASRQNHNHNNNHNTTSHNYNSITNHNKNSSSSTTGTRAIFGSKQQQQQQQQRLDTRLPSSPLRLPHATAFAAHATGSSGSGSGGGGSISGGGGSISITGISSGGGGGDNITPYLPPRPLTLRLVAILCSPFLTPCVLNLEGGLGGDVGGDLGGVDIGGGVGVDADVVPKSGSSQANKNASQEVDHQHTLSRLITVLLSAWLRLLKACNTNTNTSMKTPKSYTHNS